MMQLKIVGSDKGPVWLVQPHYRIGKGDDCDVKLADGALQDVHLSLQVDGDSITLLPEGQAPTTVNAEPVRQQRELKHGDTVKLGRSELQVIDPKLTAKAISRATTEVSDGWALQGLSTALSEKRYSLSQIQVVGRAQDCDITLGVAHLSRQHARLILNANGLVVEDLGSVNGTFVNGKRVDKAPLKSGDELRFDTLRFRVVGPDGGAGVDVDLDKTSMRPAMVKPVAPQPKPRVQERPSVAARSRSPQRAGGEAVARNQSEPQVPVSAESTSRGPWWMLAGVLAAALAALWYFDIAGMV